MTLKHHGKVTRAVKLLFSHFVHVKTMAEKPTKKKRFKYIFKKDYLQLPMQTEAISKIKSSVKKNTIMVSHFSAAMPKSSQFSTDILKSLHNRNKYWRSSDQMSSEPVNDEWLKGGRCHSYVQAKAGFGAGSCAYRVCGD